MTKENLHVSLKVAVEAAAFIFPQCSVRLNKGQSGHTAQHIRVTAIRKQCQLILYTMGFCQIEIVTAAVSIYTVSLWCKLRSTICEKADKKRGDNRRNMERCWWGLMGGKYIITHHHVLIVSLSNSTSVEDAVIVSLSVSLLSRQTSSLSAATPPLKQDPKQQRRCPRSTLKNAVGLAMCSGVISFKLIILPVKMCVKIGAEYESSSWQVL